MKRVVRLAIIISLLFPFIWARAAWGVELTITDNGSGSTSEITTQVEQTTTVTQENQAEVTNNVNIEANTGDNSASENSGETNIVTGDVISETVVQNTINTSAADIGCCDEPSETVVNISGNGESTNNEVNYTDTLTTTVTINQQAQINNIIKGMINTGNNTASGNLGNVTIETGNISGLVQLSNQVNNSQVTVTTGSNGEILIKVNQNGAGSQNTITLQLVNGTLVAVNNNANVNNEVDFDLNTGGNTAQDNLGDVWIKTGDIDFAVITENEINDNIVIIDNCCEETPEPPEPPVVPPVNPPVKPPQPPSNGGGGNGNGNGSSTTSGNDNGVGGVSDGQVLGAILPATGTIQYMLALMANIIMFLLGVYLRLKSGRAPAAL